MKFFITGSGTDVGKTYLSCLVLDHWIRISDLSKVGAYKPISCGDRHDAELLANILKEQEPSLNAEQISPWCYKSALAPMAASLIEGWQVKREEIYALYQKLAQDYTQLLVEGAGGWQVPVTQDYRVSDIAKDLALPVIVVVNNRLGALNETILTVEAIEAQGLECRALVLNHPEEERDAASISNRSILETTFPHVSVVELMHDETQLPEEVAAVFS